MFSILIKRQREIVWGKGQGELAFKAMYLARKDMKCTYAKTLKRNEKVGSGPSSLDLPSTEFRFADNEIIPNSSVKIK